MEILKKINDFVRINFIGRPLELNRLVFDDEVLLQTHEEVAGIIKAYRLYYGWQYLGNIIGFCNAVYIAKLKKNNKIKLFVMLVISPVISAYAYSHFTYWDIIRQTVIDSRGREREVIAELISEAEKGREYGNRLEHPGIRMKYNASNDLHKQVQGEISFLKCLIQIFKF
jgi:hypothetical protein